MLQTYTLKNGLKVATYSIPEMKSVFLALSCKSGAIFDTPQTSGVAHFMEHLLVSGIPSLPNVEEFSKFIESIAGSYNAATYTQLVRFYLNAPVLKLEDLIKVSSEVFYQPLFPTDSLEKERQVILTEIRERQDSLWYKNDRFFSEVRYKKGHPMLLDVGGSEATVAKLTRDDLMNYWQKFFHPTNTYLVLVGGFKKNEAKDLIVKIFDSYPEGSKFIGYPKITNQDFSGRKMAIRHDSKLNTCYLDLTFPSLCGHDPLKARIAGSVTRYILGGLRVSRLYKLLRQQKGLVYHVGFGSSIYETFGYSGVYTQVSLENLDEVIDLIVKELLGFFKNGPTEEEFKFVIDYSVNRTLMSFDSPGSIADWIEGDLLWEDKIYTIEESIEQTKSLTIKDITDYMKKYWDFSKLNLTIQGPIKNTKENVKKYSDMISDLK